jgi:hypothetical protein
LHHSVDLVVERSTEGWLFEPLEPVFVAGDIRGVQDDVVTAKEVKFKLPDPRVDDPLGVINLRDDATQDEDRVLLFHGRQGMIP